MAELFVRTGFVNIHLYDYDKVGGHNITNQLFGYNDIGQPKVKALKDHLLYINPGANIRAYNKPWSEGVPLRDTVVLAVDDIDTRRKLTKMYRGTTLITYLLDFRIGFTFAQHYAARCGDFNEILKSMEFSQDEAKFNQPKSPCNSKITSIATIKTITSLGFNNFLKIILGKEWYPMLLIDSMKPSIQALEPNQTTIQ